MQGHRPPTKLHLSTEASPLGPPPAIAPKPLRFINTTTRPTTHCKSRNPLSAKRRAGFSERAMHEKLLRQAKGFPPPCFPWSARACTRTTPLPGCCVKGDQPYCFSGQAPLFCLCPLKKRAPEKLRAHQTISLAGLVLHLLRRWLAVAAHHHHPALFWSACSSWWHIVRCRILAPCITASLINSRHFPPLQFHSPRLLPYVFCAAPVPRPAAKTHCLPCSPAYARLFVSLVCLSRRTRNSCSADTCVSKTHRLTDRH